MKEGLNFELRFNKYGLRTSLVRLNRGEISVYYLLDFGIGDLTASFSKGIWFYIDFFNLNKEENYQSKGFSLPIWKRE